MQKISFLAIMALTSSCVTSSKPDFKASKVIERISGKDETPMWATGGEAMTTEGSDVVFLHTMSMSGNSRSEACMKSADLDAKAAFLRHIQEGITTSGQLNDQSVTDDPSYESLTAFISNGKISGARTVARYWEKREESDADTGERKLRLHCAVKVAIKKSELEKQLRTALGNGGNAEIRQKLLDAQKSFIDEVASKSQSNDNVAKDAEQKEAH